MGAPHANSSLAGMLHIPALSGVLAAGPSPMGSMQAVPSYELSLAVHANRSCQAFGLAESIPQRIDICSSSR
jgi:hypothetical protein